MDDATGTRAEPPPTAPAASGEPSAELVAADPAVLADSFSQFVGAWWKKIRNGESGVLPIVLGLVAIVIIFQTQNSKFISAGNITNLFVQAAFFILLGLAEMFALLLSEIDLSVGFVGAVGATLMAALVSPPYNWPWWAAIIVGLLLASAIGAIQGFLITRLGLPSFVVTLGGLLGWAGFLIYEFDVFSPTSGGVINISNNAVIYNLVNGNISPIASWIAMAVVVALFAGLTIGRTTSLRKRDLAAPPMGVTILRIAVVAAAGVALVAICNVDRGTLTNVSGVPWVIPFVLIMVVVVGFFLARTRTGRYIYAIGASPEAARRAGINVARIRTLAFTLVGFIGALAGLVYMSRLGSISVGFDGGTYVLYAVAAAVIGGTSLFGGRGKAVHALLGGIVLAAVANGLDLLGISTAGTEMATAAVLVAAVTVDAVVRRRGATGN